MSNKINIIKTTNQIYTCDITNNFIDFITIDSSNYLDLDLLIESINNECYIDLSNFDSSNIQYYKLIILLAISISKNIILKDNIHDLDDYLKELTIFFNNINQIDIKDYELIYNNNDILIYKINNIYFLYNLSNTPKRLDLPLEIQNKNFYSVICNNDKYLKETFIFGKYSFYLLEEI